MYYQMEPGVLAMQKCSIDHHKKMDEILAELILAHGGTKSSQCENCGSSLIVTWYGVDRWEMRELPPRGGIERK